MVCFPCRWEKHFAFEAPYLISSLIFHHPIGIFLDIVSWKEMLYSMYVQDMVGMVCTATEAMCWEKSNVGQGGVKCINYTVDAPGVLAAGADMCYIFVVIDRTASDAAVFWVCWR